MLFNLLFAKCDAPEPWQIGVQDPASPNMEGMIYFHHYLMFFVVLIGIFVCWMLLIVIIRYCEKNNAISKKFTHSSALEIIWTVLPAAILLFISIPSFMLLYATEDIHVPGITVKITGRQWYWTYEYSDFQLASGKVYSFDSYMLKDEELNNGTFRLLEVDNRLVLPTKLGIRLLITSSDVVHCWAVPSLGVKLDAVPGRISQASLYIKRSGVYYGECSEICGVGHALMPIVVKAVSQDIFTRWIALKLVEEDQ